MCGLSGSGKSTVAAQIAENNENTVIVSSDAIREELTGNYEDQEHNEEVFKIFHDRIRKNLENKKNVVADATNLTMKSRRAIMMKVNGLDINKVCIIIPKPFEQCKEDNLHREHPVPEAVLDKQIRRFQNTRTLGEHSVNAYKLFCDKKQSKSLFQLEYRDGYAMGAKLHDIGKPTTQSFDDEGIAHYFNHAEVGSYIILSQMKIPALYPLMWNDKTLLDCCFLINYHMMPFNWTNDKTKQRWKERFGEHKYQMLLDFNECDKAR